MTEISNNFQQEIKTFYERHYREGDLRDNAQLYDWVVRLISSVADKKLLDVGCGGGWTLRAAAKKQLKTYGLDISSNAAKKAKKLSPTSEITVGNGESLPFKDNVFDYVTCLGSLEHFVHTENGAKEIFRVLKPKGTFAILLPNKFPFEELVKVFFKGSCHEQWQITELLASKIGWKNLLERNGLKVNKIYKYNKYPELFQPGTLKMKSIKKFIVMSFTKYCAPFNFALSFVYVGKKYTKQNCKSSILQHIEHK